MLLRVVGGAGQRGPRGFHSPTPPPPSSSSSAAELSAHRRCCKTVSYATLFCKQAVLNPSLTAAGPEPKCRSVHIDEAMVSNDQHTLFLAMNCANESLVCGSVPPPPPCHLATIPPPRGTAVPLGGGGGSDATAIQLLAETRTGPGPVGWEAHRGRGDAVKGTGCLSVVSDVL